MPLRVDPSSANSCTHRTRRADVADGSGDLKGPQLMSATPINTDAIYAAAEAAVRGRVALAEAIVTAQQAVGTAEENAAKQRAEADAAIKAAEATKRAATKSVEASKNAVHAAMKEALTGGWTAAELRDIGLTVPTSVIAAASGGKSSESRKRGTGSTTKRPRISLNASEDASSTNTGERSSTGPAATAVPPEHQTQNEHVHADNAPDVQSLAHTG